LAVNGPTDQAKNFAASNTPVATTIIPQGGSSDRGAARNAANPAFISSRVASCDRSASRVSRGTPVSASAWASANLALFSHFAISSVSKVDAMLGMRSLGTSQASRRLVPSVARAATEG